MSSPVWPSLKELVQEPVALDRLVDGRLWYKTTKSGFPFSIPHEDLRGATFLPFDKGMLFMRWIRKALEGN